MIQNIADALVGCDTEQNHFGRLIIYYSDTKAVSLEKDLLLFCAHFLLLDFVMKNLQFYWGFLTIL